MKYINLCPHAIVIINVTGQIVRMIEPSGQVARCEEKTEYPTMLSPDVIPLIYRTYGAVTGLPEEDKTGCLLYIVSHMVRQALPHRLDLASPGDTLRDEDGRIIGCKNLVVNDPSPEEPT